MMPISVAAKVASSMGTNTSVGCAAPIWARYTIILTGMIVSPDVLSTKNIIIGLEAVAFISASFPLSEIRCLFFSTLSSCMLSIAFSPSGVAALSNPSMLAAIFMKMCPVAGCPLGMSGKRRVKTGLSRRERALTIPPFSPIFITPIQRESTPVSPMDISKAVLEFSNVELMMSANTPVLPAKHCMMAHTAARRKNAIQM